MSSPHLPKMQKLIIFLVFAIFGASALRTLRVSDVSEISSISDVSSISSVSISTSASDIDEEFDSEDAFATQFKIDQGKQYVHHQIFSNKSNLSDKVRSYVVDRKISQVKNDVKSAVFGSGN